jgi:hypothetical protein
MNSHPRGRARRASVALLAFLCLAGLPLAPLLAAAPHPDCGHCSSIAEHGHCAQSPVTNVVVAAAPGELRAAPGTGGPLLPAAASRDARSPELAGLSPSAQYAAGDRIGPPLYLLYTKFLE